MAPTREPRRDARRRGRVRAPRVLYLAFYFPPTRASGVFRSTATANFLAATGWDVTVMSAPSEFFTEYVKSFDPSMEEQVDPAISVERPAMSYYPWETDLRKYGWFRANFPEPAKVARRAVIDRLFPEAYVTWIPHVFRRAVQLHRHQPFDLVLATGNPFAAFGAAWLLGRGLRTPYVLDYRDSWTLNLFTERPAFPPDHPAWAWERRVMRDAAAIVFVNQALLDWHADRYPSCADRMTVVPNGFEPELLGLPSDPVPLPCPVRFGFVGTVTSPMPLEKLFAAWRLARQDARLNGATMKFYGYLGFFPANAPDLLKRLPIDEDIGVSYEGPVEKQEIGGAYAGLDVLVFLAAGGRYVTSGKVFEYMATGKPIVSVHDPSAAAADVLRGHPLWVDTPALTPEAIAKSLLAGAELARRNTAELVKAARAHAETYSRTAVLAPMEARLRTLAGVCGPRGRT